MNAVDNKSRIIDEQLQNMADLCIGGIQTNIEFRIVKYSVIPNTLMLKELHYILLCKMR